MSMMASPPIAVDHHTGLRTSQRESRHVHVSSLPDHINEDHVNAHFSKFGRVQKVERVVDGFIVSFMDVGCARKANSTEQRLDGFSYKISFHDHSKSSVMTSAASMSSPRGSSSSVEGIKRAESPHRSKEIQRSQGAQNSRYSTSSPSTSTGKRGEPERRRESTSTRKIESTIRSPADLSGLSSTTQGLQGVYLERLPNRSEHSLRSAIIEALKRYGRAFHIQFDGSGDERRAIVLFNRVSDLDRLQSETIQVLGARVKLRLANHVAVSEANNAYLMANSAIASGTQMDISASTLTTTAELPAKYSSHNGNGKEPERPLSAGSGGEVDVFHNKASRTLYVGGLESKISDETLRKRFRCFGSILDVDVKNYESPSPFAFIQFSDIFSTVRAINHHANLPVANKKAKKFQPFFGRSMQTNKLWVGGIPPNASEEYVQQKLSALDGANNVIFDIKTREALVVFQGPEIAQAALNKIRNNGPKPFTFKDGSGEARVPADFCSDRLHDFFIDRKHSQLRSSTSPHPASNHSEGSLPDRVLTPPPNPPPYLGGLSAQGQEMPSYISSRDYHRSSDSLRRDGRGSISQKRRERSRSRDRQSRRERIKPQSRQPRQRTRRSRSRGGNRSGSSSSSSESRKTYESFSSSSSADSRYRRDRDRRSNGNHGTTKRKDNDRKYTKEQEERPNKIKEAEHDFGMFFPKRSTSFQKNQFNKHAEHSTNKRVAREKEMVRSADSGFGEETALLPPPPPPAPSPPPPPPPTILSFPSTSSATRDPEGISLKHPAPIACPASTSSASHHLGNHEKISTPQPSQSQPSKRPSLDVPLPSGSMTLTSPSAINTSAPPNPLKTPPAQMPRRPRLPMACANGKTLTAPLELLDASVKDPRIGMKEYPTRRPTILLKISNIWAIHFKKERAAGANTSSIGKPLTKPVETSLSGRNSQPTPTTPGSRHGSISSEHEPLSRRSSGAVSPGPLISPKQKPSTSQPSSSAGNAHSKSSDEEEEVQKVKSPPPSILDFILRESEEENKKTVKTLSTLYKKVSALGDTLNSLDTSVKQIKEETDKSTGSLPKSASLEKHQSFEVELEKLKDKEKLKIDAEKLKTLSRSARISNNSSACSTPVHDPLSSLLPQSHPIQSSASTPQHQQNPSSLSISIPPSTVAGASTPSATLPSPISRKASAPQPSSISSKTVPPHSAPILPGTPSSASSRSSTPMVFPPNFSIPPPPIPSTSSSPTRNEPLLSAPPQPPALLSGHPVRRDSTGSIHGTPSTHHPPPSSPKGHGNEGSTAPTTPKTHRPEMQSSSKRPAMLPGQTRGPDGKTAIRAESFGGLSRMNSLPQTPSPLVQRSMSVSDSKKTAREANDMIEKFYNRTSLSADMKKLPRIEKKPSIQSESGKDKEREKEMDKHREKEKEHKHKHRDKEQREKDHKLKRKEDGTYETKEERAKRKEIERSKKQKDEKKKEKKEKLKKLAESEKKRKEKKEKKKKKRKHSESEEESGEDEGDDDYAKTMKLVRLLAEEDGPIGGSMYDRVKRRSSGLNKDDQEKKKTLEMLREKNKDKHKKRRVMTMSDSDEENEDDEEEQDKDDDSSEEEEEVEEKKPSKQEKSKHTPKPSKNYSTSESDESGDEVKKKEKKEKRNFNTDDVFGDSDDDGSSVATGPSLSTEKHRSSEKKGKEEKRNRIRR
ncbi:unnamed protein product, partial [Mesorhabditis belari]|uniref:RRM domain-containing protein n=1 Tax=Mesorhabditis belari TaxID=2138241 RepID=A0AAF3J2S2_9BILA